MPGKEEYLDSEKYEIRAWDWDRPGNIVDEITALNRIRRDNPALQTHLGIALPATPGTTTSSPTARRRADRSNVVLVAVNLDPHRRAGSALRGAAVGIRPARRRRRRGRRPGHRPPLHLARQDPAASRSIPAALPYDPSCAVSLQSGARPPRHDRRDRPAMVQGRDHLPGARQVLLRRQRRRHRRLRRPDRASSTTSRTSASPRSGCCRSIRRRCATTATTSPTIAASIPTTARCAISSASSREAHERGLRVITELVINHTSDQHPWFQRARRGQAGLVGSATSMSGRDDDQTLQRDAASSSSTPRSRTGRGTTVAKAYYWHRFYSHQPDLNFDNPRVLRADPRCHALLARHGRRRAAPRRHALPDRARRHQQREPARDARRHQEDPRRDRRALPRPHAAGRGQPVARGHAATISARATNATWRSTSR